MDVGKKKKKSHKGAERMVLTATTTDQAYETMYDDDDEMLGKQQIMPWFDPNYMATNPDDVSFAAPATYNNIIVIH